MSKYPKLTMNLSKLKENLAHMKSLCDEHGIDIAGVVKGCNGNIDAAKTFVNSGINQLASSRIAHLKAAEKAGISLPRMLIRIPMKSEVSEVVAYADISLNSEIEVIRCLNEEAISQNKIHQVILMVDLGDLREGFWDKDKLIEAAVEVEDMSNISLLGIGTNLGCYGAIVTTKEKMLELVEISKRVEKAINRKVKYISGGGTMAIPLLLNGTMPKEINHLRIGEAILLARDLMDVWPDELGKMNQDVFTLELEVVEIKDKPTYPVGEIMKDGFGLVKEFTDEGIKKRAILAGGKVDYGYPEMLIPVKDKIKIWGASSDHTMIDISKLEDDIKIGDIFKFELSYANLVYVTLCSDIKIHKVE